MHPMTSTRQFGWTALTLLALVGCDAGTTSTPNAPPMPSIPPTVSPEAPKDKTEVKSLPVEPGKAAEPAKTEEPKGAAAGKLSDEEIAEIKKLAPEDQAIALAQVTCPVSGDNLGEGGMGVPVKEVIDGKTFFLCCKGCEKDLKADPAKYLAKLKK
jgi:hypothetical protein